MAARFVEPALTAIASVTSLRDIGDHVLPQIEQAIDASAALLYRYDDDRRLVALAGTIAHQVDGYARDLLDADPVQHFPRQLEARPRVVHATRHVERRTFRRSVAYGEFYGALGLEHLVCVWLTHLQYGAPGMTGLLLARPPGSEDFGAPEHAILARLLPALAAATERAERLSDLELEKNALASLVAASSGPARLVLSRTGKIVCASPACEELLTRAGARAIETIRRVLPRSSEPRRITTQIGGEVMTVHLTPIGGPAADTLVLVELERGDTTGATGEGCAELARRGGLTRAESAVLAGMADGLGNRALAERLHVSVETVRTHVRRVLGKLGLRSRTDAVLAVSRQANLRDRSPDGAGAPRMG